MVKSNELFNLTLTPQKFNDEPVTHCKHCLSLNIKIMGETDYCDECGSTETKLAHIEAWILMYEYKYGIGKVIKK